MIWRFCLGVMLTLLLAQSSRAQETPDRIRFGFFPPPDTEIVYRVDYLHKQTFGSTVRTVEWTHEVHFRFGPKGADGLHSGDFYLHSVRAREGAQFELNYLMAKAVENEVYSVQMKDGVPVEVDWPAIKAKLESSLPKITDPRTAHMMLQALPAFEPDGVSALLRPFWATGIGYLRAFNRDGSTATFENLDLPSWFQVPGSTLITYGGKEEGTDDLLLIWKLEPTPKAAVDKLGPELRQMALTVTSSSERASVTTVLDRLLAGDIEAVEAGIAAFDPTPGLMRSFQLDTRLVAGDLRRETKIVITRTKPD